MSSNASKPSDAAVKAADPDWLAPLLGSALPGEGEEVTLRGVRLVRRDRILRGVELVSSAQAQTADAFGFKWRQRETFERPEQLARVREWLVERYGDVTRADWFADHGLHPLVLDAGCGGAMSAVELFGPKLGEIRYLGVDVSTAVDVAQERCAKQGCQAAFLQADLMRLPLPPASLDMIFSEGVLHHTDSTEAALKYLATLLKPGGRFLFYVYRKKGPVREFTDDYVRRRLQGMAPEAAWKMLEPLTRLGQALGELNIEIDIPEPISILEIPAGRINLQRLFYWHFAKAFYRPDYSFDEMNHVNYDWYAPENAHRQTIEDVRRWCAEANLAIERERTEEAGITIIARRVGGATAQ